MIRVISLSIIAGY